MTRFFKDLLRLLASYGGLVFALSCLVWLAFLREGGPQQPETVWSEPPWHEEGAALEQPEPSQAVEVMAEAAKPEAGQPPAAPPAPAAEAPVKQPVRERPLVMVDAGHGGGDGGAVWNGIIEKNLALALAQKLKMQLEKLGMEVRMTRSKDVFVSLENRAAMTNQAQADVFISVHLNSSATETGVRGIETYYCTSKSLGAARLLQAALNLPSLAGLRDRRGEKLAAAVQRMTCQSTGAANRGIKERAYTVVHGVTCPAVLVECGFISNPKEAALLKTRAYQDKLTAGIARGVAAYVEGLKQNAGHGIELRTADKSASSAVKSELAAQK